MSLSRIRRVDHVRFRPRRRCAGAESWGPRCRELGCHVAGAESRMRNPHIRVSGAIRVQRAATKPGCGELGDRQVQRTETRRRRTRLVVLKGGHRDAWPSRRGKRQVEKSREGEAHSLQGSESGRREGVKARPLLQRQEGQFRP